MIRQIILISIGDSSELGFVTSLFSTQQLNAYDYL